MVATWPRDERRAGAKVLLQALAERRIGRRDQAQAWVWRLAEITRDLHEEYAVQRWPETKRLLGLFVNSSGRAHGRNARRIVHAARQQDRRLAVALLAAAVAHTPEAEEVLRGARMRMARKPSAVARELLRNFPKGKRRRRRGRDSQANGKAKPGREKLTDSAAEDGEDVVEAEDVEELEDDEGPDDEPEAADDDKEGQGQGQGQGLADERRSGAAEQHQIDVLRQIGRTYAFTDAIPASSYRSPSAFGTSALIRARSSSESSTSAAAALSSR